MTVRVTTLKHATAGRYYTEHLPSYYLDGDEPPDGGGVPALTYSTLTVTSMPRRFCR